MNGVILEDHLRTLCTAVNQDSSKAHRVREEWVHWPIFVLKLSCSSSTASSSFFSLPQQQTTATPTQKNFHCFGSDYETHCHWLCVTDRKQFSYKDRETYDFCFKTLSSSSSSCSLLDISAFTYQQKMCEHQQLKHSLYSIIIIQWTLAQYYHRRPLALQTEVRI